MQLLESCPSAQRCDREASLGRWEAAAWGQEGASLALQDKGDTVILYDLIKHHKVCMQQTRFVILQRCS